MTTTPATSTRFYCETADMLHETLLQFLAQLPSQYGDDIPHPPEHLRITLPVYAPFDTVLAYFQQPENLHDLKDSARSVQLDVHLGLRAVHVEAFRGESPHLDSLPTSTRLVQLKAVLQAF